MPCRDYPWGKTHRLNRCWRLLYPEWFELFPWLHVKEAHFTHTAIFVNIHVHPRDHLSSLLLTSQWYFLNEPLETNSLKSACLRFPSDNLNKRGKRENKPDLVGSSSLKREVDVENSTAILLHQIIIPHSPKWIVNIDKNNFWKVTFTGQGTLLTRTSVTHHLQ